MSRRWFGTDGIRGVANVDLTPELSLSVGRAAAAVLGAAGPARLLLGRDTRVSGGLLEAAVAAGIAAAGGEASLAGVIPTPGISRLVAVNGFDGGVVISASHNPYQDNGIKLLGSDGKKLSDNLEMEIEARIGRPGDGCAIGEIRALEGAGPMYVEDLLGALEVDLSGLRVLLDCAQGACYRVGPLAFRMAGAHVETVCAEPDGTNINQACGSTDMRTLAERVLQDDYDMGLAFDGDGDRVLAVDRGGQIVDGDQILTILAGWLKEQGRLSNDTVVVTSMSNLGLHQAMRALDVNVEVTDVGDRYVLERMEQVGATLGGEQSGHVIHLESGSTGDGIQTGLLLGQVLRSSGRPLSELAARMKRFPQLLVNVRVENKDALKRADAVWEAVRVEQEALGDDGRIVLRPSGTEPLVRVMVEAPTQALCDEVAGRLAKVVSQTLI